MKHNSSTLRTNVTATTTPTVYAAHVKIKMSPIVMETSGSLFLNMTCLTNMTQQDVSIAVTRHDKRYHGISLDFGEVALGRQAVLSHVTYCGYRNSVNTTNRCNASKVIHISLRVAANIFQEVPFEILYPAIFMFTFTDTDV
ncbi:DNA-directed RNA polymerase subunit beta [Folsomia candida]|uniref:DNA-directed RNA polymerase subunit beta n=1 Tax=Folsomia candida TaxID=158441 RepID=A0A226EYK6_FOLCA|nr:DNA-directed RNA polymerase subunit beta [Folsomia candida]